MNTDVMFASKTDKWDTPSGVIDTLSTYFDWDCDVCASRPNVCDFYYNEEDDGLSQEWRGLCWMNPPYGREIGKWMEKARDSAKDGATVVCLVPARTDTRWWHNTVPCASQVTFVKGRLKFGDAVNSAPFPSAFVVFGEIDLEQQIALRRFGWTPSQWIRR